MNFYFLTLNPEFFEGFLKERIIYRALKAGIINITLINFRDFSDDKHKSVDDTPFGGGPGMILQAQPIIDAVESIKINLRIDTETIITTPKGKLFNQNYAVELSQKKNVIFICGRYEGYDERIKEILSPTEISIGDYILSNGEIASLAMFNTIVRNIDGVLGNPDSLNQESILDGTLEYPQYTRPRNFRGYEVPEILLSGNHKKIEEWRKKKSLEKTMAVRPDILNGDIKGGTPNGS